MRIKFDAKKNEAVKRKHGVSLAQAQEIFAQTFVVDEKSDNPAQFRAIGWCQGNLCSVIFEVRQDGHGEYLHLITLWRSTRQEQEFYIEGI